MAQSSTKRKPAKQKPAKRKPTAKSIRTQRQTKRPATVVTKARSVKPKSSVKKPRTAATTTKTKSRKTLKSCVLITGASSGIGLEFADYYLRTQPQHEHIVVLVSSNRKKLEQAKELLLRKYPKSGLLAHVLDLSKATAPQALMDVCKRQKLHPHILVNNAGVGHIGKFKGMNQKDLRGMMMLNMNALTELVHLFLAKMNRSDDTGLVINIASTAAFQPMPYFALYAATKAFVLSLTDALAEEYRHANVRFITVCPGPTQTHFFERATKNMAIVPAKVRDFFSKSGARQASDVVRTTMQAVAKGVTGMHIDGRLNRVVVGSTKWVPYKMKAKLTAKFFKDLTP